ncbi:MAG: LysM peptidoglycan-binding domain-containing protein [Anaerolineales bacterium]|nr:LysM peptidoglycan-binding domain-containing protein [Anaerolineales bacterium]
MMISQRRIFSLLALLLVVSLVLGGCVRPFSQSNNTETNNTATDETRAEDVVTDDTTPADETGTEANTGEGSTDAAAGDEATSAYPAPEGEESAEESDTPRIEETPTATPMPDSTEEEPAAEETAVAETDTSAETPVAETTEETATDTAETNATMPDTHTVVTGENLYRIGLQYGVSWVTLAELNGLSNPNDIKIGQVLKLPGSATASAEPTPEPTPSPATETTYTVQAGDNLFRIGLKYGLSWIQIAEANGIVNPNQIVAGQIIKIPVSTPGPTPQFTHVVKTGETLFLISLQYGVAWPTIAEANGLESPYVIYVGQTLVIPGG